MSEVRFQSPPLARVLAIIAVGLAGNTLAEESPVAIRAEHFTVPPSTGPVTHVIVRNRTAGPYDGTIRLNVPDIWRLNTSTQALVLKPGETKRIPFTIEKAIDRDVNSYPLKITVTRGTSRVEHKQSVVCTSAPYFKPVIDGRIEDWKDAIPVTYVTRGKKTVVRTYWNKRTFCLLVEVEEDRLIGYRGKPSAGHFDALQFALSPRSAKTATDQTGETTRYEFLAAASALLWAKDDCFALCSPGETIAAPRQNKPLDSLALKKARVVVRRTKGVTRYECAIPFSAMPTIRPDTGREFCFSLLVHDPDGTGIRDWGEAAGLWPDQRTRLAWSEWDGAKWEKVAPFDNKIEWGLCSSKH